MSERMHKNFDWLAQVKPENRSRTDLIKDELFDHLEAQNKPCEKVKKFVDKFIAHGAAPETRGALADDERGLTLERIESCHKIIYRVASFINGRLLWESNIGGVPVPQYDHLNGLDLKWAAKASLMKAHDKWLEITRQIENWDADSLWSPGFR